MPKEESLATIPRIALKSYLDYRNNYLTVELFAESKEITIDFARALMIEGRKALEFVTNGTTYLDWQ
jgi:hypothetical protein